MAEIEEKKKSGAKIAIIIVVVVVVGIILVAAFFGVLVLAGITFLWSQSFTDESDTTVDTMNVKGTLDASEDLLYLEIISGTCDWADYRVTVDGMMVTVISGSTSSAGETATFTGGVYTVGNTYSVQIVNISENTIVWDSDIIAKP